MLSTSLHLVSLSFNLKLSCSLILLMMAIHHLQRLCTYSIESKIQNNSLAVNSLAIKKNSLAINSLAIKKNSLAIKKIVLL